MAVFEADHGPPIDVFQEVGCAGFSIREFEHAEEVVQLAFILLPGWGWIIRFDPD
jgi:hypothetical protein